MQLRFSSSGDTTGRLLLERGDLAGRCYRFETSICQNPVCQCEHVTLRCFPETTEPPCQASIFVCLEMDLAQQDIVNLEKLKADSHGNHSGEDRCGRRLAKQTGTGSGTPTSRPNSIGPITPIRT